MTRAVTVAATRSRLGLLDRIVDDRGSLRAVAVMRVLFGVVVVLHFRRDLRLDPVPVERFHVPWWSWVPVPSPEVYRALMWVGVAAGVAMVVGLACRVATATAGAVVLYLLMLDLSGFSHNRAFLVWMLFGLTLLPTGRALALDARLRGTMSDEGWLWPVWLLRVIASSVYLTSGGTKLLEADWRSGRVLWDRVVRHADEIPFDGWVSDLLTSRAFHRVLAPSAIATELFIGLGLWFPRTRLVAIWVAIVFHASIEVTLSVQTFSYSAIAALLIWVTPSTRDRRLVGGSSAFGGWVSRLDWLARFEREPGATPGPAVLTDRDGTVRTGADATVTALSRLPLLFPVVAPALAVVRLGGRRSGRVR